MANGQLTELVRHLRTAVSGPFGDAVSDEELLERFIRHQDGDVFEVLMRRHGPMVLGVCRRILGDAHDCEDAFQATFLVLVRKACSVRPRGQVGNWLHGVARRTALVAKRLEARRRANEARVPPREEKPEAAGPDWWPLLDQEIARLSDQHRAVVILCDLEGRPRREVAESLRIPEGTVASRLARARAILARRLSRHGPVCPGITAVGRPPHGPASVPAAVQASTVKAAGSLAAGRLVSGPISTPVATLTEEVIKAMLLSRSQKAVVVLVLFAASLLGVGSAAWACWAPAPVKRPEPVRRPYAFVPVNENWIKRTVWLKRDLTAPYIGGGSRNDGEGEGEEAGRDPKFKDYHREVRYFVRAGDKQPCKMLQYYPSGALESEADQINKEDTPIEQFYRCCYPDGRVAIFVHWKTRKVMEGTSTSRDGRVTHQVKDGEGELIYYSSKGDYHVHSWYSQGFPYLEKHYPHRTCVEIRLNDSGDSFITRPGEENLHLDRSKEYWTRRAGKDYFQRLEDPIILFDHGERSREADRMEPLYPQRRLQFMKSYGERLRKAGKTWRELKIDFIRQAKAWPE